MLLRRGAKGGNVGRLQSTLAVLGFYVGKIDGDFGPKTEDAVEAFQRDRSILVDGIVGNTTWGLLMETLGQPTRATVTEPDPNGPRRSFTTVPADKLPGVPGYNQMRLREDVAEDYMLLLEEVHSLGGVLLTGGGKRRLTSKSSPSRSRRSMHYLGRAFDLPPYALMQNWQKDPYIVTWDPDNVRRFEVWCKSDSAPLIDVNACTVKQWRDSSGRRRSRIVVEPLTAHAFSLTKVLRNHGFEPVGARRSFLKGGSYAGAETWHFENREGLLEGDTFGGELRRLYSLEQCRKFVYWDEVKNDTWKNGRWT